MREFKKGSLGLLVLHLLYERPSYGYELCERLRTRSEGALSFEDAAIYPLLHTYEREGLVAGYWERESDGENEGEGERDVAAAQVGNLGAIGAIGHIGKVAERRGPRRRFYRLTPRGVEALRAALQEWQTFSQAVGRIVGRESAAAEENAR
jgi:DNA-binding PadR family transcriptional regulator